MVRVIKIFIPHTHTLDQGLFLLAVSGAMTILKF